MANRIENENKPIYKKVWFWIVIIIAVIIIASIAGGSEQTEQTSGSSASKIEELKTGETWTVEGQWNLTINSVKTTTERNEFSDKNPNQVVYITYTYENLGYEDKNKIMDGLYIDLETSGDATIIDENGEMAYSYPGNITTYPQQTPVGAKCVNAETCVGLNNKSNAITMNIKKYDGNGKEQKVKYILSIDN